MRKILYLCMPVFAFSLMTTSCRMAPKEELGDTVAAKVFEPIDTAALHRKQAAKMKNIKDSADIFYVGPATDQKSLQLISYPSRRDTLTMGRTRHIKRSGSTDIGNIVRIALWTKDKDTLVSRIEEYQPAVEAAKKK
ncbi:MAG TPA: hypothetical protein DHV83_04410 [Prevotella sp.]|uniref:hypothetical protein n=1 Tax=Hallella absiana TaxID=2925336 RepID=UPI000ED9A5CE|nr:hypothetical protein [Hallella absiana]MDD5822548.1 hypothetical protein [Prevotella sp.]HCJ46788.1 hypothetical protein [Prevotella sp.]